MSWDGPDALDAPATMTAIRSCVHCGICLPQCPTYRVLGEEMDSPRGRIYLMRAVAEKRLDLTDGFRRHLDLCLGCRACETACPAGVPFGSLLETSRAELERRGRPLRERLLSTLLLAVFPYPDRVRALLTAGRLYRRSGLQALVRSSGLLRRLPRLDAMERLLGDVPAPVEVPESLPARGRSRGRVAVLTGCVQRHLYADVNRDTVRLLALAGWDVVVPRGQECCGALDLHAGRLDVLRRRATALGAAFPADVDWVVTNAAGCGSAMREYGHWTADEAAARLATRTRDVTELLADADLPLQPLPLTVTYHDACHLVHGQKVRSAPRALLAKIPGLTVVPMADSELCCGSAGVYNILEPDMAERLLEHKIRRIIESGARTVVTGNPGCLLQIASGCRRRGVDVEVIHPVTLVARAVGGEAR
jgi:glycolate oxidase iron-sulfur subunit